VLTTVAVPLVVSVINACGCCHFGLQVPGQVFVTFTPVALPAGSIDDLLFDLMME
jgi:hypothetical protein